MKRSNVLYISTLLVSALVTLNISFQACSPNVFTSFDSSNSIPTMNGQGLVLNSSLGLNNIPFHPNGEAVNWNGPDSRVGYDGEVPYFSVNNKKYPIVMLAVNSQANYTEALKELNLQIDLAIEKGFKVIELVLANHSISMINKIQSILANKDVYVLLRFDLWTVASATLNPIYVIKYTLNQQTNQWSLEKEFAVKKYAASDANGNWSTIPYFSSLSKDWLIAQKNSMYNLIKEINKSGLSKKIIGFKFAYLEGGEWFEAPFTKNNKGEFIQADYSDSHPWLKPDMFYLGDYGDTEYRLYNEWLRNQGLASQDLPDYLSRTKPTYKNTFISANLTNSELNVLLYNRFQSERVLWLQKELASVIKQVTNKKALVAVNNGYLFSLAHSAGSVHTALSKLFLTAEIDIIAAPYNYTNTRKIGEAFIPHGPSSSSAAYQKLWLHEDDSRPYWYKDYWNTTKSHAEDLGILVRNVATSLFHKNGIYLLDLYNVGWFGSSERLSEGKKTWEKLSYVYRDLIQGNVGNIVVPEVAVVIDDNSYNYVGEFGMHKEANYSVTSEMIVRRLEAVAKIGAPVRYHIFQDLNNCALFKNYKMVVFLNQFEVNSNQMQMINSCLKNSNRTLYFQFASGIYGDSRRPNVQNMSNLLEQAVTVAADENLRFTVASKTLNKANYKIYYEPHPFNSNTEVFRSLAASAGVHLWADSGIVIDGRGDKLMIHTNRKNLNLALKGSLTVKEIGISSAVQLCQNCSNLNITFASDAVTKLIQLSTTASTPPITNPNNPDNPPVGLFREGTGGFVGSANGSYCSLSSTNHLISCGFSQIDYNNAVQVLTSKFKPNTFKGMCDCTQPNVPPTNNSDKLPIGLFREGQGGFVGSANGTYCLLNSGEHLQACGYSQSDFANAPQFLTSKFKPNSFKNLCDCTRAPSSVPNTPAPPKPTVAAVPVGLFRDGFGGFRGSKDGTYCTLSSGEHLKKCGFTQTNYDNAKQFSLAKTSSSKHKGPCNCN